VIFMCLYMLNLFFQGSFYLMNIMSMLNGKSKGVKFKIISLNFLSTPVIILTYAEDV
jgi:hypothetical protein